MNVQHQTRRMEARENPDGGENLQVRGFYWSYVMLEVNAALFVYPALLIYKLTWGSSQPCDLDTVFKYILQMKKSRLRLISDMHSC